LLFPGLHWSIHSGCTTNYPFKRQTQTRECSCRSKATQWRWLPSIFNKPKSNLI